MNDEECEALQHPPCSEPGCEERASCPGHRSPEGKVWCSRCAARIMKSCQQCGSSFEPEYGGYDCYAPEAGERRGEAFCLGCWSQYGYDGSSQGR